MKTQKFPIMKSFSKILYILLTCSLFYSCSLFEWEKPDPYEYEKNRHRFLRCKVNGEEWSDQYYFGYGGLYHAQWEYFGNPSHKRYGELYATADYRPEKDIFESLFIQIDNMNKGDNIISMNNHNSAIFLDLTPDPGLFYYLDTTRSYSFYVSEIDTVNHILKGTFHFTALTKDKSKAVIVTDGEFDWKPYWYL